MGLVIFSYDYIFPQIKSADKINLNYIMLTRKMRLPLLKDQKQLFFWLSGF